MRTEQARKYFEEEIGNMLATNKVIDMVRLSYTFFDIAKDEATELLKKVEYYNPTLEVLEALISAEYDFEAEVELITDQFTTYPYIVVERVDDTCNRIAFSSSDAFTEEELAEEIKFTNTYRRNAENFKQYRYDAVNMALEEM